MTTEPMAPAFHTQPQEATVQTIRVALVYDLDYDDEKLGPYYRDATAYVMTTAEGLARNLRAAEVNAVLVRVEVDGNYVSRRRDGR